MKLRSLACLTFGILTVLPVSHAFATGAPSRASRHPALQALGFAETDLPEEAYLVRSAGDIAPALGLTVHARRRDTWLVSGTPEAIARLRAQRLMVAPLAAGPRSQPPEPRIWTRATSADPAVQAAVDSVTWARVSSKIAMLSGFTTRYAYSPACAAAAESLCAYFQRLGLDTQFHAFQYGGRQHRNVVATQPGAVHPDSIIVIGAHYDDVPTTGIAPGADDNASGTAAVMIAAELLGARTFDYTIRYVCFAAEELGLVGSDRYAAYCAAQGDKIAAMLNYDMIGWWQAGVDAGLEVEVGATMTWLADAVTNAAELYTSQPCNVHVDDGAWWGDHYSFWQAGYAAVNNEESWDWGDPDFNPNYHTRHDTLENMHPDYAVACTQVAVASLATLAKPQQPVSAPRPAPAPRLALSAHPNPFSGNVTIEFTLERDEAARVTVYDVAGRRVAALAGGRRSAGRHTLVWEGRAGNARPLSSGVYVLELETDAGASARARVVFMR